MHKPYKSILKQREDFKVKYRFYSEDEGGRAFLPFQGISLDFWYEHHNHTIEGIFMIWPEFEDKKGDVFINGQASYEGVARMFIVNNKMRTYHQERLEVGVKGYFHEGIRIAECTVIEIIDLHKNPID